MSTLDANRDRHLLCAVIACTPARMMAALPALFGS
jgi:hypothetical protein